MARNENLSILYSTDYRPSPAGSLGTSSVRVYDLWGGAKSPQVGWEQECLSPGSAQLLVACWGIQPQHPHVWKQGSLREFMLSPFFGSESHSVMSHSLRPHGLYSPWNSLGQNTGEGSLSLLQGIFPTQGSNPVLPYCRWFLYQLSHKGSPFFGPTEVHIHFLFLPKLLQVFSSL